MIDPGFKLTAAEMRKLDEFRGTAAYGTYLTSIKTSPIYSAIVREYVKNVDVKSDVVRLQNDGHLPDGVSSDVLTNLFKQSVARMAINMVADTIIMLELEAKRVDEVLNDIRSDSDIVYLLGMADEKYYKEAESLLENGKLDKGTVAYRGLVNWTKLREKLPASKSDEAPMVLAKKTVPEPKKSGKTIDFDSLDITIE